MCASWFSKKGSLPPVRELVFMHNKAKWLAVKKLQEEYPGAIIIAWFPDTQSAFQQFASEQAFDCEISLAREVNSFQVAGKTVIFLEHYPLSDKETSLLQSWKPTSTFVLSALDEPLFTHFGGERIIQLMQQMGMKEDEPLEHTMITSAIQNAQQKLAKKVTVEHTAASMEEWFRKNI
jgi:hypothetical protein